jgi:serine phosphatase RsbU (regulator of sigma subunit)
MPNAAYFELTISGQPDRVVPIDELPFLVGRGRENGNHLTLNDASISRKCIAISTSPNGLQIEDRGQLGGIFVNGRRVTEGQLLHDGDLIRPGAEEACQLIFRSTDAPARGKDGSTSLDNLLDQAAGNSSSKLDRLTLLLEATSLLHTHLPLDSIFATMLDHAISVTNADRGMLLVPDESGALLVRVARNEKGETLATDAVNPSSTVIQQATEQQSTVINEDLRLADLNVQTAHSVVVQFLRSAVVIPLYNLLYERGATAPGELLGALYLDSKRTSAFSVLDRKILDALGTQAANILENARLMQHERERQRLEQELSIAQRIQQALVPQGLRDYPHLAITGIHRPCHEVGGDYFDVFPLADGRIVILVADVSGKGLGAALVTAVLQGALSGMLLGIEPVKLIDHLNKFLLDRADLGRYLTMFVGLLGPEGILEFVPAGHPSPLLLRYGKVSELYTEGSFPIGLIPEASFTASRVQLEPDDTLLLFTDGVTEAEDKKRSLFETERLMEAFARHSDCSLDRLQSGIFDAVEKFSAGTKQSDDITLLLVRYRKTGDAKKGL